MDINLFARKITLYVQKKIKPRIVEQLFEENDFKFQTSGYYKFDFLVHNYKKSGCDVAYYHGFDPEDKAQGNLNCKSKFVTITYPTGDKKDFMYQMSILDTLYKRFEGYIYDPKTKRVISIGEVKFLY